MNFTVSLPGGSSVEWDKATFTELSAWGNGANGTDVWGWGSDGGGATPQIMGVKQTSQGWVATVSLTGPEPSGTPQIGMIARVKYHDGSLGVVAANLTPSR